MLCQFSFKNFKSYKETTTFDFQATSIPEFSESLLKSEKADALLPVGVIYGPNGGGKTNLLLALSCLISTVVKPIYELEKAREKIIIQLNFRIWSGYYAEGDLESRVIQQMECLEKSNSENDISESICLHFYECICFGGIEIMVLWVYDGFKDLGQGEFSFRPGVTLCSQKLKKVLDKQK